MIKPVVSQLNASAAGIMNVIRNEASPEYRQAVPTVEQTVESIKAAGTAIMAFQPRMNEFVNIANRIAAVYVTSKMYENPWAFMKKGTLEFGETVEEIFVNLVKAEPYDAPKSPSTVFKRRPPDVRTMFHAMDLQTKYPVTISRQQLNQAFLSASGVISLIEDIVSQVYSAARYDEFIMMKYTIAVCALNGVITNDSYTAISDDDPATSTAFVKKVKKITGKFGFMSSSYNVAGVPTFSNPDDIYCIITTDVSANIDVDVLAQAFNLDKVTFMGRQVPVDSFSFNEGELERLDNLMSNDPNYTRFDEDDLTALATIGAVICDKNFPQFYDNLDMYAEQYNADGLYWNEFYHVWRTYSASPFSNVVMLSTEASSVTTVTVNGPATVNPGESAQYVATVVTGDFTNKGVTWSVVTNSVTAGAVTIDQMGTVNVSEDATGSFTVKAVSSVDSSKYNTKSVTIS